MKTAYRLANVLIVLLLTLSFHAHAVVKSSYSTDHYRVYSNDLTSLLKDMRRGSPIFSNGNVFHGNTKWSIRWKYWYKRKSGRCQIGRVETTLSITYTMPKLISSNPDVKRVFNRWYRRLDLHEKGHAKLAKNAATRIDRLILDMSPRKSCKQLGKEANELGHVILNQLKMENKVYDKRTKHGCTQGGCLSSYL